MKTAKNIAKQIAQEPLEILRTAKEQVIPEENHQGEGRGRSENDDQIKLVQEQQKVQDKMKSTRRMEALNRELSDIQKQDKFSDLQARIAQGEEIPLEDYSEFSMEQKQVLKAQMQAVRIQMENAKLENEKSLAEPATRKGRQLFSFGKKTQVQREQTHVEKPVPPSG